MVVFSFARFSGISSFAKYFVSVVSIFETKAPSITEHWIKILTHHKHISANYAITYRSEISLRYRLIAIIRSLCRAEAVLPRAAELAGEVGGKVFKFHAGLFLIIDPAAELANIFHS